MQNSNARSVKFEKLFLLISALFFVYILLRQIGENKIQRISFARRPPMIASNISTLKKSSCEAERSIVYLKTHKTGSSTLLSILRKHKKRHEIGNEVTAFPKPFYGGYPGYFRKAFAVHKEDANQDLLMGHFRFDGAAVKSLMNSKAKYVSIMRYPLKQFESSFYYYYGRYTKQSLAQKYEENSVVCHGYPYLQVTGKFGVNFSKYIELAGNASLHQLAWYFRSRNYQSYDLGLDPSNDSLEYIFDESRKLNSYFDLVLITEHLLESLVLLKELLCMEWSDIIPPVLKKGSYEAHAYSNQEAEIVSRLNRQDIALYNFFNKTLWRKIKKYGNERMKKDVAILENLIHSMIPTRDKRKNTTNETTKQERRRVNQGDYVSNIANQLLELARKRYLSISQDDLQEFSKHMVKNFGWCPPTDYYK